MRSIADGWKAAAASNVSALAKSDNAADAGWERNLQRGRRIDAHGGAAAALSGRPEVTGHAFPYPLPAAFATGASRCPDP